MTNILGEESVKTHSNDTSFMVLLDGVEEGFDSETEKPKAINIPHLLREYAVSLPWIGGALCSLLLLLFLFNFGDDESDVGQDIDQTENTVQIGTVTRVREVNVQLPEKKEPVTAESTEKSQPANDQETLLQVSEKNAPADEVLVVMPVEKSPQQNIDQEQTVVEQAAVKVNGTVEKDERIENGTAGETVAKEAVEAQEMQTSQETVTSGVVNIIKLRPTHVKKKPALSSEPQRVIIKAQPRKVVRNVVSLNGPFTANQLYDTRVSAGLGWDSREKEKMYTVQLMVLTSKTAEKNLKKMLAQVNYRQEAGNFYIFKKETLPEKIFIFYGEYPSIERARLAQNSLPKFLRDHKPYALSIKGAIAKVRK
ncbi:MAG: hypothetical protein GQ542_12320 [Desulforhopalus sp.]|nr:hypothetical protein [Desulforhopalus sp.]